MIPNIINTIVGLALAWVVVLHPTWAEQRYVPLGVFGLVIFAMALWARYSDARRWFSTVNMVLGIALGMLSLLPLATMPLLAFWGGFWIGSLVPTIALWAVIYRPKPVPAA